jgi:hypothetical protein
VIVDKYEWLMSSEFSALWGACVCVYREVLVSNKQVL